MIRTFLKSLRIIGPTLSVLANVIWSKQKLTKEANQKIKSKIIDYQLTTLPVLVQTISIHMVMIEHQKTEKS